MRYNQGILRWRESTSRMQDVNLRSVYDPARIYYLIDVNVQGRMRVTSDMYRTCYINSSISANYSVFDM